MLLPSELYIDNILNTFKDINKPQNDPPNKSLLKKLSIKINDVNHFCKIYDTILSLKFSCEKEHILSEIYDEYNKSRYHLYEKILPNFLKNEEHSAKIEKLSIDKLENRVHEKIDINPLITLRKNADSHNASLNILKSLYKLFGVEDMITHEINEKDKKQVWESAKIRVIGLYLYDTIDEKIVTVSKKLIREDPILKKYKYTEEDQTKLSYYLKSTRECVKYGTFMPIRLRS